MSSTRVAGESGDLVALSCDDLNKTLRELNLNNGDQLQVCSDNDA